MLVDGEHYPPVIEAALDELRSTGAEIAAIVLVGGREKLPAAGVDAFGDVEVVAQDDPWQAFGTVLDQVRPDAAFDLSDEPVLDYRARHQFASLALARGVPYEGADFRFEPPTLDDVAAKASISIIGTGKRTGKTAVAGFAARTLVAAGHKPVIVAMGRGGPPEPEVLRGDELTLEPGDLLALADSGKHAASDYVEDALLGRVPTVGCRRCGGGLAGGVRFSNVLEGAAKANEMAGDLLLFEGSGSAIPPVRCDATALIVPASIPEEYLAGYMGPYRLLLADLVVVTMCESPFGPPSKVSSLISCMHETRRRVMGESHQEVRVVRTVFRPTPTRSVEGATVFVATTAPESTGELIKRHLEEEKGCRVAGISHALSDRRALEEELQKMGGRADVLLCEIKAAGIDVATRQALKAGLDVIYMDNVPVGVDDDDPVEAIEQLGTLALGRYDDRAGREEGAT